MKNAAGRELPERIGEYVVRPYTGEYTNPEAWGKVVSNRVPTLRPANGQKLLGSLEEAIRAMLKELDPHSTYNDAAEVKRLTEPLQGNFEGIGVQFNMAADTLIVIQTVSGGPSQKVGILAGDRIVSVDHDPIAGVKMSRDSIMQRLRGPKGTRVELGVVRRGVKDQLTFIVTRDVIPVHTLEASFMVEPKVGYIRLGSFGATTHDELAEALRTLLAEGMVSLVLDLEGNGGGYLQAAVEVASEFLNEGDLIVYTEGRRSPRRDFHAVGKPLFAKGRMAVIVDEYSASAAEIVSGAVQDWDRGVLIGRRSFGKGLVQRQFNLTDNSAILLTIARYYSPSGRCIQRPYDKGSDEYYSQFLEELIANAEADSLLYEVTDSTQYHTKKGRIIYGGGGITPDHILPYKKDPDNVYYNQLNNKGIVSDYAFSYISDNIASLKQQYPTLESFAGAEVEEVEEYIHSCGFFRAKARDIVASAKMLIENYGGRVPDTMEELLKLPGVGRKTANLILGDVYNVPGSTVVDTHCIRISNRLGLVDNLKEPEKIERELRKILPPEKSSDFCHRIVLHGRAVCDARKPDCESCCLKSVCQTAESK